MGNKIPPLYGENKDKYLKLAIENIEKAMHEDISDKAKEALEIALEANKELLERMWKN